MPGPILRRREILLGGLALTAATPPWQASAQPAAAVAPALRLVAAAETQIGVTVRYDPAYARLAFPGGDVPRDRGVCTDVIVRAYRDAFDLDLQARVNADMRHAFAAYPRRWGLAAPDPHIDHRRVPNLEVYFARQGAEVPKPTSIDAWRPGDIVSQRLSAPGAPRLGVPHIGIVSSQRDLNSGRLLVIHNIGLGTRHDDILATYEIIGRYRYLPVA